MSTQFRCLWKRSEEPRKSSADGCGASVRISCLRRSAECRWERARTTRVFRGSTCWRRSTRACGDWARTMLTFIRSILLTPTRRSTKRSSRWTRLFKAARRATSAARTSRRGSSPTRYGPASVSVLPDSTLFNPVTTCCFERSNTSCFRCAKTRASALSSITRLREGS